MAKRKLSAKQLAALKKGREKRAKMLKSSSRTGTRKSPVRRKSTARRNPAKRKGISLFRGRNPTNKYHVLKSADDRKSGAVPTRRRGGYSDYNDYRDLVLAGYLKKVALGPRGGERYVTTAAGRRAFNKATAELEGIEKTKVISARKNPRKSFGRAHKNHYLMGITSSGKMYFAGDRFTQAKSKAVTFPSKSEVRIVAEEIKDRLPKQVNLLAYEYS